MSRVVRLQPASQGTRVNDLRSASIPPEWRHRWRQLLAGSADTRAALFARGVILVEGETDQGAFNCWFASTAVVGTTSDTLDARNLLLLPVDSDKNFGAYVSYLRGMGIPWVILCDGPVLSPQHETTLAGQLRQAGLELGSEPELGAPFGVWKTFWEEQRVFTVADQFGGVPNDRDKRGEIEAFFERLDRELWHAKVQEYPKSKARAGHAFAEAVDFRAHPAQQAELRRLWSAIIDHITK